MSKKPSIEPVGSESAMMQSQAEMPQDITHYEGDGAGGITGIKGRIIQFGSDIGEKISTAAHISGEKLPRKSIIMGTGALALASTPIIMSKMAERRFSRLGRMEKTAFYSRYLIGRARERISR